MEECMQKYQGDYVVMVEYVVNECLVERTPIGEKNCSGLLRLHFGWVFLFY
jgi:hypothetical protein